MKSANIHRFDEEKASKTRRCYRYRDKKVRQLLLGCDPASSFRINYAIFERNLNTHLVQYSKNTLAFFMSSPHFKEIFGSKFKFKLRIRDAAEDGLDEDEIEDMHNAKKAIDFFSLGGETSLAAGGDTMCEESRDSFTSLNSDLLMMATRTDVKPFGLAALVPMIKDMHENDENLEQDWRIAFILAMYFLVARTCEISDLKFKHLQRGGNYCLFSFRRTKTSRQMKKVLPCTCMELDGKAPFCPFHMFMQYYVFRKEQLERKEITNYTNEKLFPFRIRCVQYTVGALLREYSDLMDPSLVERAREMKVIPYSLRHGAASDSALYGVNHELLLAHSKWAGLDRSRNKIVDEYYTHGEVQKGRWVVEVLRGYMEAQKDCNKL